VKKWYVSTILLLMIGLTQGLFAQIPNGGFENWVTDADTNLNPVGWETTNSYPQVTVDRVSPGFQGNYAIRVRTVDGGFPFPGVAMLHTALPFGTRPTQFTATFRSTLVGGDVAFIIIGLMLGDSVIASVQNCTFRIDTSFGQFTTRNFTIAYQSALVPDSVIIFIAAGLANGHVGTELIVDEISFSGGGATDVSEGATMPRAIGLSQNFPNPFNPSTSIRYELPAAGLVKLAVYNLLGQQVALLVNGEQPAGSYEARFDAAGLSSGVYLYRLSTGSFTDAKRMLLVR
jgi:hypothetical protein